MESVEGMLFSVGGIITLAWCITEGIGKYVVLGTWKPLIAVVAAVGMAIGAKFNLGAFPDLSWPATIILFILAGMGSPMLDTAILKPLNIQLHNPAKVEPKPEAVPQVPDKPL